MFCCLSSTPSRSLLFYPRGKSIIQEAPSTARAALPPLPPRTAVLPCRPVRVGWSPEIRRLDKTPILKGCTVLDMARSHTALRGWL